MNTLYKSSLHNRQKRVGYLKDIQLFASDMGTIDLRNIEKMTQLLAKLEEEIKEIKELLRLVNESIDKYDKYAYLNVS